MPYQHHKTGDKKEKMIGLFITFQCPIG